MTVVKVQRPVYIGDPSGGYATKGYTMWLIYDKFKARESTSYSIPHSMLRVFDAAPPNSVAYFKQYFDAAEWDPNTEEWDLSNCVPITRRLIW